MSCKLPKDSIAERGLLLSLAIIEKASIDEAFLDLTLLTIKEILHRHPHLAFVPSDAPQGMDTPLPPPPPISWAEAGNVFPVRGEAGDGDPTVDYDGNDEEGREGVGGWEDIALCIGAELMARLRGEVREKLGYTCSAVSMLQIHVFRGLNLSSSGAGYSSQQNIGQGLS